MTELNLARMEGIEGGGLGMVGIMCGLAFFLSFSVLAAPLAAAPGTACIVGLYAEYGDYPRYNG